MPIVIKKRISLEFLGEDYKDSYLIFKSISVSQFDDVVKKTNSVKDNNSQAMKVILELLEQQFLDGKFLDQEVKREDLKDFDVETIIKCFEMFTGRTLDPKA